MVYYYLIIFGILAVGALFEQRGMNHRTTNIVRFIAFFVVFLTAAFKYETGVDWMVYQSIFTLQWPLGEIFSVGINDFFTQFGFEPGYMFLTSIIKEFGGNIQSVYFIVALINILLLYSSLSYFSKYPILCLLGYYCFVFFILDMSGIRQALALNLVLYGMRYACERNWWKYLFFILLAASCHQTAFFLIVVYPLFYKQHFNLHFLMVIYFASLAIMLLKIRWLQVVTSLVLPIIGVEGNMNEKIVNYVFSSDYDDMSLNIVKVAFALGIALYVFYYRNTLLNTPSSKFSVMCFFLFATINNLLYELSEVNTRVSAYLILFLVIVVANTIEYLMIYTNRLIFYSIIMTYCFIYASVYILEKPATIPYSPYQNYFIYKCLGIQSTGEKRLYKFADK